MKSWFWLYQNKHFQEMFVLIQPPTPLYQMEYFQDLLFLLQYTSSNFVMAVQGPSSHQLGRPPGRLKWGGLGGRSPPVRKKFELCFWLSKKCLVLGNHFVIPKGLTCVTPSPRDVTAVTGPSRWVQNTPIGCRNHLPTSRNIFWKMCV